MSAITVSAQDGQQISPSIDLAKAHNVPFAAVDRAVAEQADLTLQVTSNPTGDGAMAAAQLMAEGWPLKVPREVSIVSQVPTGWEPARSAAGDGQPRPKTP